MSLPFITLAEILRDFLQYIYIVIQALGIHIGVPTQVTFIKFSNWLNLDLYKTIDIRMSFTMFAQLVLLIFCSAYLFALTLQQIKRNIQGLDGQTYAELGSFMKFFNLITIFIITTLFQPMIKNSLSVWFDENDHINEDEDFIMKILSIISLFIIIIIIPIIFIKGIISSRPEKNKFDKKGGKQMSSREIYQEYLGKTQSPFKPIFREYCYQGAYFKLIIMIYKFIQLVVIFEKPKPHTGLILFIIKYSIFFLLSLLLFSYIYIVRPYLNNKLNTLYLASILATIWCLGCNVGLLFFDTKNATNQKAQFIAAVVQLIGCFLIFFLNFFNIILMSFPFIVRSIQKMKSQLIFTEVSKRGNVTGNLVGLKQNKYLKYVMFNPKIYDKQTEISINIWQDFWIEIITTDQKFKSQTKVNNLVFVNQLNSTPYLKKFGGKVEERFEENTRILQKIGRQEYQEELNRLDNPDYKKLILFIYRDISPLDSYYESEEKQVKGFCKVQFHPFPAKLTLSFDNIDKQVELQGYDNLNEFYLQNMSPEIIEKRLLRTKIRALNDQILDFSFNRKLIFTKGQESDIKDISKSVDMDVCYQYGKFIVQSDFTTNFQIPNGPKIDVGKGLRCFLTFNRGIGQSIEGRIFKAPAITLNNEDLQLDNMEEEDSLINQIIQKNQSILQTELRKVQDNIEKYKMSMIGDFLQKQKVLSYGFNLNVFSAPYENLINSEFIYKELKKEMNFDLEFLSEKEKYKFVGLYEVIDMCVRSDYMAYLYLLFKDIWKQNNDMSIIQKNEDLINPNKPTCIIYSVDKNLNEWKEIFFIRGLRQSNGKGYFNDKIFDNINSMLKIMNDTPKEMLVNSVIIQENYFSNKNSSFFDRSRQYKESEKNLPIQEQQQEFIQVNTINNHKANESKDRIDIQNESQKQNQKLSENPTLNHLSMISNIPPIPLKRNLNNNKNQQIIEEIDSKYQTQKSNSSQNNESYQKNTSFQVDSKEENIFTKKENESNQLISLSQNKTERTILGDITSNSNYKKKSVQVSDRQELFQKQNSNSSQKEIGTQTIVQIYSNEESRVKKFSLSQLLNKTNSLKLERRRSSQREQQQQKCAFDENQKGNFLSQDNSNKNDIENKQDVSNQDNCSGNNVSFNNLSDKVFFEEINLTNKYQNVEDILEQKEIHNKN